MKKIMSLLMACVLALGLTATAFAATPLEVTNPDGRVYKISDVLATLEYAGEKVYKVPVGATISVDHPIDEHYQPYADFTAAVVKKGFDGNDHFMTDDDNSAKNYTVTGGQGKTFTFTADKVGLWRVDLGDNEFMSYVTGVKLEVVGDTTEPEPTPDPKPATDIAYASPCAVTIDGKPVQFDAYMLKDDSGNGTNYVKVRDMAMQLNGTAAQFNVGWNGAIDLTTKTAYVPNGTEMSTPFSGDQSYEVNPASIFVDGQAVNMEAILLTDADGNGYTYYKVRDLGKFLGFNVGWDGQNVTIDTTKPYAE